MSLMDKLATERRARLAAERMLELKSAELFEANRKLSLHARSLSDKVTQQDASLKTIRAQTEQLQKENTETRATLKRAEETIMTTKERFGNSIEALSDGIALFDHTDVLVTSNTAFLALFEDLTEIAPGATYTEILTLAAQEGIVDTGDETIYQWIESMLDRWDQTPIPDRTVRLWNNRHLRLHDSLSSNGDRVTLMIDITEQVEREEELHKARQIAEAAARTKTAFLANMSHELRTPMNGVVGMADLLIESELDAEQRLYIDTIKSSGHALLTIINDVLDFSKLEAEKMELHPEPFDLEKLIQEILMLMRSTAQDKGLDLCLDYDLFLPTHIVGDPGRIRQILTNLIGNALKFTNEGHVMVHVVGYTEEDTGRVNLHIAVEDSGIGIPEDKIDHVFGEFNQVEDAQNRRFDGTGLGLAITRELVNLMEGEIWVQSELGVGSNFGFRINVPVDGQLNPLPRALDPAMKKVMLVHSGRRGGAILQKQLEQLQLDAKISLSGTDALKQMDRDMAYDLVMIDSELNDTNGLVLSKSLRDIGLTAPILVISMNPRALALDPLASHATEFLSQPIRREELFETLARLSELVADGGDIIEAQVESAAMPEAETVDDAPPVSAFRSRRAAPPSAAPEPAPVPTAAPEEPAAMPAFRARARPSIEANKPTPPVAAPVAPPENMMRVLAAEDNRTNQLVFSKMIKSLQIDLKMVENGRLAVDAFTEFQPHLIFMDISMPEMDGKAATQQIRWLEDATPERPGDMPAHVPIVALTAHAMQGDDDKILAAGLDHYLTKPLKKDEIIALIQKYCPESCARPDQDAPPLASNG